MSAYADSRASEIGLSAASVDEPIERWVIGAMVLVAGADVLVGFKATAALGLMAVLVPVWAPALRRFAFARPLFVLGSVAVGAGLLLSEYAKATHAVNSVTRIQAVCVLLSGFAALAALLWARTVFRLPEVAALFGAGGVIGAILAGQLSWKFGLAAPMSLLLLGIVDRSGHRLLAAATAVGLGGLTAVEEGRSFLGFCILAAIVTIWEARPARGWSSRWFPILLLAAAAVATYLLGVALLTSGVFGADAQERTVQQIETSGSLITGGRPEWAASLELFRERPMGYGVGVIPGWADVRAAEAGLASVSVDLEPVRARYMLGGEFRLHSIAADLWAGFGLTGLTLAAVVLVVLGRSLSVAVAERRAPCSMTLASIMGMWFLLFGPIASNWLDVCAALGLALPALAPSDTSNDGD